MPVVEVRGTPLWVIDEGSGPPLVVLHGAFHGSDAITPPFRSLTAGRRLLAFDRPGHGRSADDGQPFHYDTMATLTIAVLERLDAASCDIIGYSDGAVIAIAVAMRRPDIPRSLTLIGANIRSAGRTLELDPTAPSTRAMRSSYGALAPEGEDHFDVIVDKTFAMFADEPNFDLGAIAQIELPALIIAGDREPTLDDSITLFRTLPNAQLAVLPASGHTLPWERADDLSGLISRFFSAPGT